MNTAAHNKARVGRDLIEKDLRFLAPIAVTWMIKT